MMAQEDLPATTHETAEAPQKFIEPDTHTFVVKIWLEETEAEAKRAVWRGHITHVASGQRRYFVRLSGLIAFMVPYLEDLNIKIPVLGRICQWLNPVK